MRDESAVLGDVAQRIGYQLRRADMISMERLQEMMADVGVPPGRATSLFYIDLHPGCDQAALGRVLGINRASTMAAVNALVALRAVERRPGRDRRSNALYLTDEGRRLRAEAVQITVEHEAEIFSSLTEHERAELLRLLVKVRTTNRANALRGTATRRAILRRVR